MKNSTLNERYIVTKSNQLNEIKPNEMSLQGLRFFSIYLSKINPLDESTRVVRFKVSDFKAIMDLGRINTSTLLKSANDLLTQTIGLMLGDKVDDIETFERFQVFKKCSLKADKSGELYIQIDAHDDALPLMFNLKGHYFKYELWNALRPKSRNQLRMYEILKQYEYIGERIITIAKLKELLGIDEDQYVRYANFKERILNSCQRALSENTDISFTYEPYGRKTRGGKVIQLKFTITKNKDYKDPLKLDKFIDLKNESLLEAIASVPEPEADESSYSDHISFLVDACDNTFTKSEMLEINLLLSEKMPEIANDQFKSYQYLNRKYLEMQRYDKRDNSIKHKFKYFKKLIGTE